MSLEKFEVIIASLPDRENLVAEIVYDHVEWAEISDEKLDGNLVIQFYAHPRNKYWEFRLDEALEILEKAKKRLLGIGGLKE